MSNVTFINIALLIMLFRHLSLLFI